MELSMLTIEAFAHYMRGAVTLFFIFWCFKLFNNSLNTTFYDYINTYRIAEACRIIDAMPREGRKLRPETEHLALVSSLSYPIIEVNG